MLDNIIGNDKAKFMTNYSKLTNELNDFLSLNHKPNGATVKLDTYNTKNKMNLFLNEKINNKNSKEKIKNFFSNEKNILDKNIFSEDFVKKEKWEKLKNTINPAKSSHSGEKNSNSVFDRIKNNLNKMKKEFTLEEAFQKNLDSLNGLNIISPRNYVFNSLNNKGTNSNCGNKYNTKFNFNIIFKGFDSDRNGNAVKDSVLVNNLNNSKNINSHLKHKFNKFYLNQEDNEGNYNNGSKEIRIQNKKTNSNMTDLNLNQRSVRNKLLNFFYDEPSNTESKWAGNQQKQNLFDRKDKIKTEIFSVLDNRAITRTETAFHRPRPLSNNLTLSPSHTIFQNNNNYNFSSNNNGSSIYTKNKITTKSNFHSSLITNFNNNDNNHKLENSFEKLNNILSNYYEERKKQHSNNQNQTFSKTTEYIKRFQNRFEKGVKLIPIEKEFKKSLNLMKTSVPFEAAKRPRSSVVDNWSKFDKKQASTTNREFTNSDILRLELINLNCYSNNEIEQVKGIEKLKVRTRKRSESINQL